MGSLVEKPVQSIQGRDSIPGAGHSCQKFPWPLPRTLDPNTLYTLELHAPTLSCEVATQKFCLDEQLTGPCEQEEWAMRPDNEVTEGVGGWGPFWSPPHPAQGLGEHPVRQLSLIHISEPTRPHD